MATDLVAIVEEVPLDEVNVEIEFELPGDLGEEIKRARQEARAFDQQRNVQAVSSDTSASATSWRCAREITTPSRLDALNPMSVIVVIVS